MTLSPAEAIVSACTLVVLGALLQLGALYLVCTVRLRARSDVRPDPPPGSPKEWGTSPIGRYISREEADWLRSVQGGLLNPEQAARVKPEGSFPPPAA